MAPCPPIGYAYVPWVNYSPLLPQLYYRLYFHTLYH